MRLAEVEVVSVRRESLALLFTADGSTSAYAAAEMAAEGFPGLHPASFVYRYFEKAQGVSRVADVTRIEWRYGPEGAGGGFPANDEAGAAMTEIAPATADWCIERNHPLVTHNADLDGTWCRCGQRLEPGDAPLDWDAKWEVFHDHTRDDPCDCYVRGPAASGPRIGDVVTRA